MSTYTTGGNTFLIVFFVFVDALQATCPLGWVMWQDSCYILLPEKMNWFEASRVCDRPGSSMIVPDSEKEQEFIWQEMTTRMRELGAQDYNDIELWIGCSDVDDQGQLICLGGKGDPAYKKWNEEFYHDGDEDCIRMADKYDGQWGDSFCDNQTKFAACEMQHDSHPMYCLTADANGRFTPKCLLNHEIKNLTAEGVNGCGLSCWEEPRCHSFNIWQQGKICQLNNATRLEADVTDFEYVENCSFFEL